MISRRDTFKAAFSAGVALVVPSSVQAALTAVAPLPVASKSEMDIKQVCQRLDVHLKNQTEAWLLEWKISSLVRNNPSLFSDILRKCGGEPDPVRNFHNQPPSHVCPVCSSQDVENSLDSTIGYCRNCPAFFVWKTIFPVPVLATKCGHEFWHEKNSWKVTLRLPSGMTRETRLRKYEFGPPQDASWWEKINYKGDAMSRFDVRFPDYETHRMNYLFEESIVALYESSGGNMQELYDFTRTAKPYDIHGREFCLPGVFPASLVLHSDVTFPLSHPIRVICMG